ncbi:MAG: hypothetical protein ACK4N1_16345 [Pseudorhizobium sp.]
MAYASHHSDHSWRFRSLGRSVLKLATLLHLRWRQRQTERMLESLPSEIRKDIGWPTSDGTDVASRHPHA